MAREIIERADEFVARSRREPHRLRVFVEGDSWFSYPAGFWKGRKLVTWLRQHPRVPLNLLTIANPGDTLFKLAFGGSGDLDLALRRVREQGGDVDVVLLSAGGNDFFRRVADVVPLARPPFIDAAALDALFAEFRRWYAELVRRVRRRVRVAPILLHGYDYVYPTLGARRILGVFPVGPWLGEHLIGTLRLSAEDQRKVARRLVDAFNDDLLATLPADLPGVEHLDLRGTLTVPSDFADEIHPSDAGMRKLADKFADAIAAAASG
jgi:lysophospholipase L1-like esterase